MKPHIEQKYFDLHSYNLISLQCSPQCFARVSYYTVPIKSYQFKIVCKQEHTVKPRPEAHMDMILFEVFLKSCIDLIPQQQILQRHYLYQGFSNFSLEGPDKIPVKPERART